MTEQIWLSGWPTKAQLRKSFLKDRKIESVKHFAEKIIHFELDKKWDEKTIRLKVLMRYIEMLQNGEIYI